MNVRQAILCICGAAAPVETTNGILNKENAHVSFCLHRDWDHDGTRLEMEPIIWKQEMFTDFSFWLDIYQPKLLVTHAKIKFYIRTKN